MAESQAEAAYEPVQQKLRLQGMNPEIGHMLLEARGSNPALAPMSAFSSFSAASWNGEEFGVSGVLSCALNNCQLLLCCSCLRTQPQEKLHLSCHCTSANGAAAGVSEHSVVTAHMTWSFCSAVIAVADPGVPFKPTKGRGAMHSRCISSVPGLLHDLFEMFSS